MVQWRFQLNIWLESVVIKYSLDCIDPPPPQKKAHYSSTPSNIEVLNLSNIDSTLFIYLKQYSIPIPM